MTLYYCNTQCVEYNKLLNRHKKWYMLPLLWSVYHVFRGSKYILH
jgi:hypothetical protein